MTTAYLNGTYLPLEQANVSAMDRGFLFGDGIYEVVPAFGGRLFRLEQHLNRLEQSLAAIKLPLALKREDWQTIFNRLLKQNKADNQPSLQQSIYLQITRGPAPVRDHAFPKVIKPTVFAYCIPITTPSIDQLAQGVHAITLPDLRWRRCDIKAITLLANVLARQEAIEQGSKEAILVRQEQVLEGAATNLFVVKDAALITQPLGPLILGGITRDLVVELAAKHQVPLQQRTITLSELFAADEVWLTSSTKEIMPVMQIDDKIIGKGKAGPLWQQMINYYQDYKQQLAGGI